MTGKFQSNFKVITTILAIKRIWCKNEYLNKRIYKFQPWKEILSEHLSSISLSGKSCYNDRLCNQGLQQKKSGFTVTIRKLTQKCSLILSFFQIQFS